MHCLQKAITPVPKGRNVSITSKKKGGGANCDGNPTRQTAQTSALYSAAETLGSIVDSNKLSSISPFTTHKYSPRPAQSYACSSTDGQCHRFSVSNSLRFSVTPFRLYLHIFMQCPPQVTQHGIPSCDILHDIKSFWNIHTLFHYSRTFEWLKHHVMCMMVLRLPSSSRHTVPRFQHSGSKFCEFLSLTRKKKFSKPSLNISKPRDSHEYFSLCSDYLLSDFAFSEFTVISEWDPDLREAFQLSQYRALVSL